jgi:restriction endonuclease Mrr
MARKAGDAWEYQTDVGVLIFNPVEHLFNPILGLLLKGPRPAWELEDNLAAQFKLTKREREAMLENGHRAWENHVAWALSRLRRSKSVERIKEKTAPDGGRRGIYKKNG